MAQKDSVSVNQNVESTKVAVKKFGADTLKKEPIKKDSSVVIIIDSSAIKDSLARLNFIIDSLKKDSVTIKALALHEHGVDTSTYASLLPQSYFPFFKQPQFMLDVAMPAHSKDELFYLLAGIAFIVGLIRVSFPKYFQSIFQLFFQTSFRQKQTREQLLQNGLPSLLMNVIFIINVSLYITLIESNTTKVFSFWQLMLVSCLLLSGVYFIKYCFLLFSGWVFNLKEASGTYIFIVFLVNKIIGIMLVPFILIQAFSVSKIGDVAVTTAFIVVITLLIYRYLVSWLAIKGNLKVNAIHFFLYLCAVEILPVLLMWKALVNFSGNSI